MTRCGECNNCGWCCQFIMIQRVTIPEADVTPDASHFYGLRGAVKAGKRLHVVQHAFMPCAAHNNEAKTCKSYKTRPQICKDFPSVPDQIEGTPCSYWFEDEASGKRGGLGSPYPTPPRFGP